MIPGLLTPPCCLKFVSVLSVRCLNMECVRQSLWILLSFIASQVMATPIDIAGEFRLSLYWGIVFNNPREPHALVWGPSYFHTKIFGSSEQDWKSLIKIQIPCKFCTFITYSCTHYGKVCINPLMTNIKNPHFFVFLMANAAWFVVVRPC